MGRHTANQAHMTSIIPLGAFERVPLTTAWPTEDGNFTPWLAEPASIAALGTVLRLELEVEAVEHWVGPFRADILARVSDDPEHRVLIENQYGRTDHRHLGQILTYLAGIDGAKTVVWIAETIQPDHRAAIDWLNTNTGEDFSFFALEIELWRISGSAPAPRFTVVASPNDWTKSARSAARNLREEPSSEVERLYLEYWTAFREFCAQERSTLRLSTPWARQWYPIRIGRTGFHLAPVILREEQRIRVELYVQIKGQAPKIAFRALKSAQGQIESELGYPLSWEELPTKQATRVAVYLDEVDSSERENWGQQHRWILDRLNDFRRVFSERVKALDLTTTAEGADQNGAPGIEAEA